MKNRNKTTVTIDSRYDKLHRIEVELTNRIVVFEVEHQPDDYTLTFFTEKELAGGEVVAIGASRQGVMFAFQVTDKRKDFYSFPIIPVTTEFKQ